MLQINVIDILEYFIDVIVEHHPNDLLITDGFYTFERYLGYMVLIAFDALT